MLEPVGTPEELYERPANRLVAGFIGSPAMSIFEATAGAGDDGARLRGEGVDETLPSVRSLAGHVIVGVRPEAARLWEDGRGALGLAGPLGGPVTYVEALGRETFVGVEVGGATLAVFVEGRAAPAPGDDAGARASVRHRPASGSHCDL